MHRQVIRLALASALFCTTLGASARAQDADIGIARAAEIALEQVKGGTVTEIERDRKKGRAVFEVEVRTDDGKEFEVVIDAADGTVLRVKQDD